MGDVNLEIKLNNLDDRVIKIEESDTPITVDSDLSITSTNPVQNKVITKKLQTIDIITDNADEWTQRTWETGEICIHNNSLWFCVASTTTEPTENDVSHWKKTNIRIITSDIFQLSVPKTYTANNITLKKVNNIVSVVFGNATVGSDGKFLLNIPEEYRPIQIIGYLSKVYNGENYVDCKIKIKNTGEIYVTDLFSNAINGIQFSFLQTNTMMYMI